MVGTSAQSSSFPIQEGKDPLVIEAVILEIDNGSGRGFCVGKLGLH